MRRSICSFTVALLFVSTVHSASAAPSPAHTATAGERVFNSVGSHGWTVPPGVRLISVATFGAAGGTGTSGGAAGGLGGVARATVAVSPGELLQINVGGAGGNASGTTPGVGGFNGGAGGGSANYWAGGGGGGASDVRTGSFTLHERILIGGGGGGGGAGSTLASGGGGGGPYGVPGSHDPNGAGVGGGGTPTGGGAGGASYGDAASGQGGTNGLGGGGGPAVGFGGGGGGGGLFGGGGGGGAGEGYGGGGGGGGSGFGPPDARLRAAVEGGNGRVIITYYRPDALVRLSSDDAFVGDGVYNDAGPSQTRTAQSRPGTTEVFIIKAENNGNTTDGVRVRGGGGSSGFTVTYLQGTKDVTSSARAGTLTLGPLAPGGSESLRLRIDVRPGADIGAVKEVVLTMSSTHRPSVKDAVAAAVKVVRR